MESYSYEYAYSQKTEGAWCVFKLLLLLLYATYTGVYLYLIIKFAFLPLGALIPITLWIMIYFTWRYTCPDYKYVIDAGILSFYVSYGKKMCKKLEIHIKDALLIAPRDEVMKETANLSPKIYCALPSKAENEAYGIAFKKNAKVYIFVFKVTRDAMKSLHYYNTNTVIKANI